MYSMPRESVLLPEALSPASPRQDRRRAGIRRVDRVVELDRRSWRIATFPQPMRVRYRPTPVRRTRPARRAAAVPLPAHTTDGGSMDDRIQLWNDLAAQIAVDSIRATTAAGSGHPDLVDVVRPPARRPVRRPPAHRHRDPRRSPRSDRFVMSKGHAAPALYAVLKAIGAIDDEQLLSLRRMGSPIQGHPAPVPELPWIDVASGSLGQGLAVGLGMALAMRLDGAPARAWVLMGDSEMAEGSVWEAMEAAAFHEVDNLIAILDLNRLGQRGPTMHEWQADVFARRAQAFGWHAHRDRRPRRRRRSTTRTPRPRPPTAPR